jgi:hypothetical protein
MKFFDYRAVEFYVLIVILSNPVAVVFNKYRVCNDLLEYKILHDVIMYLLFTLR